MSTLLYFREKKRKRERESERVRDREKDKFGSRERSDGKRPAGTCGGNLQGATRFTPS